MANLKEFIIKHIGPKTLVCLVLISKYKRKYKSILKTGIFALKAIVKFYTPSKKLSKGTQIRKVLNKAQIKIDEKERFIYNIDEFKAIYRENRIIENISIDYSKVIKHSLEDMKNNNAKMQESEYKTVQNELLMGIEEYIDRICKKISKSNIDNKEKRIMYFQNIKNKQVESFEEAIQRILFFNQILWQSGHILNGLGRLDKILGSLYETDVEKGVLNRKKAKEMVKDMLKTLHQKYWFKSSVLIGDTGQIIILGGKEIDGSYFCNELTYIFIEAIKELQIPDPKVLLRVTNLVPKDLMELSLNCIKTGIGCPLFSNDDIIIQELIDFGYEKEDAYNYVTSACWEPLIASKSIDQNNIDSLVFINPLNKMLKEEADKIDNYETLIKEYKKYLKNYTIDFINEINKITWEESPILSLFTENCNEKLKDISIGGAKYNNYGITTVSLGNTVNSILNIKKFVFEEKIYKLQELEEVCINNFNGKEDILNKLKGQTIRYGIDNDEVISLSNEITDYLSEVISKQRNKFGGKIKFGYSAPTYITKSEEVPASLDGRKNGEPFIVHISSDKPGVAYTELIQFASKLNYSNNRFNGNVIDFMITPTFIENNFSKMIDFLILSIKIGFFQMQMNVTSSETLIRAKENPKDYENLIVRVWGFSAYFNDLPESYKDLLIERALKNECKSY